LRARRVRGRSEPVQLFSVEWQEGKKPTAKKRRPAGGAQKS
jgi:hypothetical protein